MNNDEHEISDLLKTAGKREMPSQAVIDQIKQDTLGEWRKSVAKERKRKLALWFAPTAIAASVMLVLFKGFIYPETSQHANIELVSSHGTCAYDNSHSIDNGNQVLTGDTCSLVLSINNNLLFVDRQTSLSISPEGEVALASGRIYVDSESEESSVIIHTPMGQVTDIGTLFEVALTDAQLQVTMREGIVKISLPNEVLVAKADSDEGEQLVVDAAYNVARHTVAASSEHWQWTQTIHPPFQLEGRTVDELIHWASRVSGIKTGYFTPEIESKAKANTLSGGNVSAENIGQTLTRYLKAAGFKTRQTDTGLVIE